MGRTRGLLWLVAGLFLAGIAGLLAYQAMNRVTANPSSEGQSAAASGPQVAVIVATHNVPIRTQLVAADLREAQLPADAVPPGAVLALDDALGKLTTAELFEGEVLQTNRLLDPTVVSPDGRLALMMVEDEVLMAIPGDDLLSRTRVLKPGDHVDILTTMDFKASLAGAQQNEEVKTTFVVLQNVVIAGLVGAAVAPPSGNTLDNIEASPTDASLPNAILLTVSPQDALALKYTLDAGGMMDLVLRAPGVDRPFETDAVDADYMDKRFELPLEPGR